MSKASSAKASSCVTWWRKESRTCCRCCAPPRNAGRPIANLKAPALLATCNGEAPQGRRHCVLSSRLFPSPSSRHPRERKPMRLAHECRRRFMTGPTLAVALAAALFGLIGAPALAQNAEPAPTAAAPTKSKPKTPVDAPTVTVTVTNSRKADLVELQAAESGSAIWKKVLGAVKAGKQAPAKLPQGLDRKSTRLNS